MKERQAWCCLQVKLCDAWSERFVSMREYLKVLYKYHLPSFLVAGPMCLEELGVMCHFRLTYEPVMYRLWIFVMR